MSCSAALYGISGLVASITRCVCALSESHFFILNPGTLLWVKERSRNEMISSELNQGSGCSPSELLDEGHVFPDQLSQI